MKFRQYSVCLNCVIKRHLKYRCPAGSPIVISHSHRQLPIVNPVRGIVLKVLSVCVFVVMFSCVKAVADEVPAGEAMFFRSFFAIPVLLGWLADLSR